MRISRSLVDRRPSLLLVATAAAAPSILCTVPFAQENFVECTRVVHSVPHSSLHGNGRWLARVPDVNGDGVGEICIGSSGLQAEAGRVQLVDGRTGLELFHVDGAIGDMLGYEVASAGDVDRDGVPDILASAPHAGAVRILSGVDGALLREVTGAPDAFGVSLAEVGDIDLDGVPDFAVGEVLLPMPNPPPVRGRVSIVSAADGHELRSLAGPGPDDRFGARLAGMRGRGNLAVFSPTVRLAGRGGGRVSVFNAANGSERFELTPLDVTESFTDVVALDNVQAIIPFDQPGLLIHGGRSASVVDGRSGQVLRQFFSGTGEFFARAAALDDVDGDHLTDVVMRMQPNGANLEGPAEWLATLSGLTGDVLQRTTLTVPFVFFSELAAGPDVDGDGLGEIVTSTVDPSRADLVIGPVLALSAAAPVQVFGQPEAGSGRIVPQISIGGCPRIRGRMRIETERVVGGALGALVLGAARANLPFHGGFLYPRRDVRIVHRASGVRGVPGAGDASLELTLPSDPALTGLTFYAQAAYADGGAFDGVALTRALKLTLY